MGLAPITLVTSAASHPFSVTTYRTFFGSLALSLLCMTFISLTHRSMHAARLSKPRRTVARMAVALLFAGLAAGPRDSEIPLMPSLACIAVATSATMLLVALETWIRLGSVSRHGGGEGAGQVTLQTEDGAGLVNAM